jgi:hypothetical protein
MVIDETIVHDGIQGLLIKVDALANPCSQKRI